MAELNINGRIVVKNFKKQFKEVFGGSLRVYKGQNFADDDATLASIRTEGCKGGELTLRANMLVGNFEEKMQELFGIKVQVADADDKKLVDNALTLGAVGRGEVKKKAEKSAGSPQAPEPKDDQKQETNNNNQLNNTTMEKKTLELHVDQGYCVAIIPIVGEENNETADEMISNGEIDYDLECDFENYLCENCDGEYRTYFHFYESDEDHTWTVDGEELEDVEGNSIDINECKGNLEDNEIEPDDNFRLIAAMEKPEHCGPNDLEIFNDIKNRNKSEDGNDDHVDIIKDAICRIMKRTAKEMEEAGVVENADDVRFSLQVGEVYNSYTEFTVETDGGFDPKLLHTLDCTDWVDCSGISDMLQEKWPDNRLADYIIYDGKFYVGDSQIDSFDYQSDIVNSDLESLM